MRKPLLLLFLIGLFATPDIQAQRLQVSVMDLNVTSGLTPQEAGMLTDKLLNELVKIEVYKVVERSKRDEILKEQSFQQTGACDQGACLVEAGQLLGVQKMVGGTIGKMGSVFAVELRMMDVKTGEIDMAFSQEYSGDVSALLTAMKEAAAEFSKWKPKPKTQTIAETKTETGSLKIVSTPPGATIFLDGNEAGTTPGLINKLDVGEHQVIVTKGGYSSFSKAVTVAKNITTMISAVLTKEYGTLKITSEPVNAAVNVDGLLKGTVTDSGLSVTNLDVGIHKLQVTRVGYFPYEVEITVESRKSNTLNVVLEPKPGSIMITSTPIGAQVSVDGRPQGNTPCSVNNLTPGAYNIKVEKQGYEVGQISVNVGPGESVARSVVLKKTLTPAPSPGGRGTGEWGKEIVNEKDGSILIEIPAGEFTMGSNDGGSDENPVHTVHLDRYYIGKYEVTVGQFRKFCNATGKTMPEQPSWNNRDDHPVVNVSWNDAKAYCDWAGLRLPTEAEWEKAARGTDGRKYPWGNTWDNTKCNSSEDGDRYGNTSPVGSFPSGVSTYGAYDMAGNVWEWCNDWYGSDYYGRSLSSNPTGPSYGTNRVLRGGSFRSVNYDGRVAYRLITYAPGNRSVYFGFRTAK